MQNDRTQYYLAFTDAEGWHRFQEGEYGDTLGFKANARVRAQKIPIGALLVCYITQKSKWCGILRVMPGIFVASQEDTKFPARYPVRMPIEPVVILPTHKAIQVDRLDIWGGLIRTRDIKRGSSGWAAQARLRQDLVPLEPEDGDFLFQKLEEERNSLLSDDAAGPDSYDPGDGADDRERQERAIITRRGQAAFRNKLIKAYQGRCAISGCDVKAVLEAAHVTQYTGLKSNVMDNGLLLRADLHTLWDCGLLAADPDTRELMIDQSLLQSEYAAYEHKRLREAKPPRLRPSQKALQSHLKDVFQRRKVHSA